MQYPAGFTHGFHRGKIAFQRLDRAEMEPLRMPGLIQITIEPSVDVNAFRTAVIDREDTIKLIIDAVCKFFNKKSVQIVEANSHISG